MASPRPSRIRLGPDPALALPRRVEDTSLHRALRENLRTFFEGADRSGRSVPRFIERELSSYLVCGIPAHGFLRLHCKDCGLDRILPFSCKGRGFCPSCGGRRMAEFAAHFVDAVIPRVPTRQWVLSLPFELRFRLAYDHRLLSAVLGVVMRAILGFQRRRGRERLGVRASHRLHLTLDSRRPWCASRTRFTRSAGKNSNSSRPVAAGTSRESACNVRTAS